MALRFPDELFSADVEREAKPSPQCGSSRLPTQCHTPLRH
jgi:hypothetical protein